MCFVKKMIPIYTFSMERRCKYNLSWQNCRRAANHFIILFWMKFHQIGGEDKEIAGHLITLWKALDFIYDKWSIIIYFKILDNLNQTGRPQIRSRWECMLAMESKVSTGDTEFSNHSQLLLEREFINKWIACRIEIATVTQITSIVI